MDGVLEKSAVKRVKQALISNGLSTEITVLAESARSAAEAASALGIEVGQIASSNFLIRNLCWSLLQVVIGLIPN
jgi:hypothetical protein